MLSEFIAQNTIWFFALLLSIVLFGVSCLTSQVKGVTFISTMGLPQLQRNPSTVLVDVRNANKFASSHVLHARNIPFDTLNLENKKLTQYKENDIVLLCETGQESIKAAKILQKSGFAKLHILRGGMMQWNKENLPIQST